MRELVDEVRARGEPDEKDVSIAAHLMRLRDPKTGLPLSEDLLTGEFGVYFAAGIETGGNAMGWTLYPFPSPHPLHPSIEDLLRWYPRGVS
jgi:cytochrome P450